MIDSCDLANPASFPSQPDSRITRATRTAVATNDSQKPAEVTATGSVATRTNAAMASTWENGHERRSQRSKARTATVASVRRAGSEAPESQA